MQLGKLLISGVFAATLVAAGGCTGSGGEKSEKAKGGKSDDGTKKTCLSIVNGKRTSKFPSVVLLAAITDGQISSVCTGTFVGPNTVLTASHCGVTEDPETLLYLKGDDVDFGEYIEDRKVVMAKGIRAKKIMILSKDLTVGDTSEVTDSHRDLAVLIFKNDIAPAVSPILTEKAKPGEVVTLVGFGMTTLVESEVKAQSDSTRNSKRYGKNEIAAAPEAFDDPPGILFLTGRSANVNPETVGSDSAASHGDSGGPIFVGKAVAGVASTGIEVQSMDAASREALKGIDAMNVYSDVTYKSATDFFKKAEAQGAVFERATATDTTEDPSKVEANKDAADDSCS